MRKIGKSRLKELAKNLDGKLTEEVRDEAVAGLSDMIEDLQKVQAKVEGFHRRFKPMFEDYEYFIGELTGIPSLVGDIIVQEEAVQNIEALFATIETNNPPKPKTTGKQKPKKSTADTFQDSFFGKTKKQSK